ncbi:hydrogenase formation protein HypD [bacterium CG2_30_37_16]|nr:MAG: hydrogenase formation protein HypD [bacterium CG2_30_37_16]
MKIMEVCGSHTAVIVKSGLASLLPPNIELISGPGCPVCVTAQGDIDNILEIAQKDDVLVVAFGDMLKVPGTRISLKKIRAERGNVEIVYSPLDVINIAESNSEKTVLYFAVGFETTVGATAALIKEAKRKKIRNLKIYSTHKLIMPAMKALLDGESEIDGFILPGHVSTVTGYGYFEDIAKIYKKPAVVAGFWPENVLESVEEIQTLVKRGKAEVKSVYKVVLKSVNMEWQKLVKEFFVVENAAWRGFGKIPKSGLDINDKYKEFDAKLFFNIKDVKRTDKPGCSCGEVIKGMKKPAECSLFGKACVPDNPFGPCMVSEEGSCSVWYKYSYNSKIKGQKSK